MLSHILSSLNVAAEVNLVRQLCDVNLEPVLNLIENLGISLITDKGDGQTLGSEAAGTANAMKVGISVERHVEVEDDVDLFNIDATAEELCCDEDAVTELLEALVNLKSIFKGAIPPKSID